LRCLCAAFALPLRCLALPLRCIHNLSCDGVQSSASSSQTEADKANAAATGHGIAATIKEKASDAVKAVVGHNEKSTEWRADAAESRAQESAEHGKVVAFGLTEPSKCFVPPTG
jgi:hypothetical protein